MQQNKPKQDQSLPRGGLGGYNPLFINYPGRSVDGVATPRDRCNGC